MRKIGICSDGQDLKSKVRYGMGLSSYVCIAEWDTANNSLVNHRFVDTNDMVALMQTLASEGVEALVAGNVGPWAYNSLASQGIGIYDGKSLEIQDAVKEYFANNLSPITSPNTNQGRGTGRGQGIGRGGQGQGIGRGQGQGKGIGRGQGQGRGQGAGRCQGQGQGRGGGRGRNRP